MRWEGSLISNRIYNDKPSGSRFIPILLPGSEPGHIPGPVLGHGRYLLATFDLTDPEYEGPVSPPDRSACHAQARPRFDQEAAPEATTTPSPRPPPPSAGLCDEQHLADVRDACREGLKKLTGKI